MPFPEDQLPVTVEIYLGVATGWEDVTDYVRGTPGNEIVIRRGFADEGGLEPSSCTLTLDNRTGRFTPRNPLGPYYGRIGRNTPIRVAVGLTSDTFQRTETDGWGSSSDGYAWSVNSTGTGTDADFSVSAGTASAVVGAAAELRQGRLTGGPDIADCEARVTIDTSLSGPPTGGTALAGIVLRSQSTTSCYWFALVLNTDGSVGVLITAVGESGPTFAILSAIDGLTYSGQALRMAASAKGSQFAVKVWDATGAEPSDWQLTGTDTRITAAGDVGLRCSVGSGNSDVPITFSFSDFEVISRRFVGEVSEWPPKWEVSGTDYWTPVTAQGILRRLQQGDRPVRSPLTAAHIASGVADGALVAYWPCEDGAGSNSFSSALAGGSPLRWSGESPDRGENGVGPLLGSDRLPFFGATTRLSGAVPESTDGVISVSWVIDTPVTPGWADDTPLLWIRQSTAGSTVATWEVRYHTTLGGALQVRALDEDGAELDTSAQLGFDVDDLTAWFRLVVEQSGGDTLWTLIRRTVDDDGRTVTTVGQVDQVFSGLVTTHATTVEVAPSAALEGLVIGQIAVAIDDDFGEAFAHDSVNSGLVSFVGEQAHDRAERLAGDANVSIHVVGDESTPMGPQATPSRLMDALAETTIADQGMLFETRYESGLTFRTRSSLYNQFVALTLDFEAPGEIAPDLEPIDDDQLVRNDVTVRRKGGSSARVVDSTSRMGTQPPPDGVGIYETQVEVNVDSDGALPAHAAWRVHLGTWDEPRFPQLVVDQTALAAAGKLTLVAAAAGVDVGDRVRLQNLPVQSGVVGDIDVLALGYVERIGLFAWVLAFNTRPYGPWDVGTYQDTDASGDVPRYDGDSSTTSGDFLTGTDSSLTVATSAGPLWTTAAAEFPLLIKVHGVTLTVSTITGSTSPQTFTISGANLDGVTIPSGSQVRVARPGYYAL